jgi:hypothetical protein
MATGAASRTCLTGSDMRRSGSSAFWRRTTREFHIHSFTTGRHASAGRPEARCTLDRLILVGEQRLLHALREFVVHSMRSGIIRPRQRCDSAGVARSVAPEFAAATAWGACCATTIRQHEHRTSFRTVRETAEESWGVSGLPPCREAMSMPPSDAADASLRAVALLTI